MSLFRRRRSAEDAAVRQSPAPPGTTEPEATEPGPADPSAAEARTREAARARSGPFDSSEESGDSQRVDLGALRVPARPGMELRLELEDQTQRVIAATIGLEGSTVQIQVFAAPRTEGIWDEIRPEIAAQVTRQGGSADELSGSFGRELLARLPVRTPDGRTAHRPTRFVGVDGPRWFLRAVFSGPAASDDEAAEALEDVVRGVVVVRGREAMAPRDLLPLTLPAQGHRGEAPGAQDADDGIPAAEPERPALAPFERGPEITERR